MIFLEKINQFVWGGPTLILILTVGIYISIRTGFVQFRLFPKALNTFLHKFEKRERSSLQALCTALAATVGTGNLAGVAGAIAIGGPGAVFWMWICAFLGMALKFAEATLSVQYRTVNSQNEYVGGPMYMIRNGMPHKWNWLAMVYCFFGVVAAFGVGNATQINTLVCSVNVVLNDWGIVDNARNDLILGVFLALLLGAVLLGGAKRIGSVAETLVPFAALLYILLALGVLILRAEQIPGAFCAIISGAFRPQAVTGGMIGSAFQTLRIGVSRGVFTNEAGMGTAGIAHGSAEVTCPAHQGLMGIMEVFIDTLLICTLTALVILCSGVTIPYGSDCGIALTTEAFSDVYGNWVRVLMMIAVCLFAFATVLGWGLYGNRCAQYLLGERAWKPFAFLQMGAVLTGALLNTRCVWLLAEFVNGLMAIPALIVLAYLTPSLKKRIQEIC